jgi:hypothetical protein
MKSARLFGFILAAMLLVSAFVRDPALAQLDEAAALDKRVIELYQAGKFPEGIPVAQRSLAILEKIARPRPSQRRDSVQCHKAPLFTSRAVSAPRPSGLREALVSISAVTPRGAGLLVYACAVLPPSTTICAPVIKVNSSDARARATVAISSAVASR